MTLVLALILVALVAGFVAGGSLRGFEHLPVHWWGVAIVGLGLQASRFANAGLSVATLIASYVLLLCFAWINRRLLAAPLLLIGLTLNLAVVAPNAGMPVRAAAVRTLGATAKMPSAAVVGKHHLESERDRFALLGDTIPVPKPFGVILSIGDLFLYAGIAVFVVSVMIGRPGVNRRPPARFVPMYRGKHLPPEHRFPRSAGRRVSVPAGAAQSGT